MHCASVSVLAFLATGSLVLGSAAPPWQAPSEPAPDAALRGRALEPPARYTHYDASTHSDKDLTAPKFWTGSAARERRNHELGHAYDASAASDTSATSSSAAPATPSASDYPGTSTVIDYMPTPYGPPPQRRALYHIEDQPGYVAPAAVSVVSTTSILSSALPVQTPVRRSVISLEAREYDLPPIAAAGALAESATDAAILESTAQGLAGGLVPALKGVAPKAKRAPVVVPDAALVDAVNPVLAKTNTPNVNIVKLAGSKHKPVVPNHFELEAAGPVQLEKPVAVVTPKTGLKRRAVGFGKAVSGPVNPALELVATVKEPVANVLAAVDIKIGAVPAPKSVKKHTKTKSKKKHSTRKTKHTTTEKHKKHATAHKTKKSRKPAHTLKAQKPAATQAVSSAAAPILKLVASVDAPVLQTVADVKLEVGKALHPRDEGAEEAAVAERKYVDFGLVKADEGRIVESA